MGRAEPKGSKQTGQQPTEELAHGQGSLDPEQGFPGVDELSLGDAVEDDLAAVQLRQPLEESLVPGNGGNTSKSWGQILGLVVGYIYVCVWPLCLAEGVGLSGEVCLTSDGAMGLVRDSTELCCRWFLLGSHKTGSHEQNPRVWLTRIEH